MGSNLKYLLCRPRGGLNDTLCQIETCWSYCEKYNRILIIDTTKSGLFVDFSELFISKNSNFKFQIDKEILTTLNSIDCQFPEINGRIDKYISDFEKGRNYVLRGTNIQLTFNFEKDYKERLLVLEQCGGGVSSLNLLRRLKLSDRLKSEFLKNRIEGSYKSIHVRNTDYRTDYRRLLSDLKQELKNETVLVCSDDHRVIEESIKILSESIIISKTSNDFVTKGKPLHSPLNNYSNEQKLIVSQNSIIDLLLLASSEKIYYSNLENYSFYVLSGFTKLALLLNNNKNIIQELL